MIASTRTGDSPTRRSDTDGWTSRVHQLRSCVAIMMTSASGVRVARRIASAGRRSRQQHGRRGAPAPSADIWARRGTPTFVGVYPTSKRLSDVSPRSRTASMVETRYGYAPPVRDGPRTDRWRGDRALDVHRPVVAVAEQYGCGRGDLVVQFGATDGYHHRVTPRSSPRELLGEHRDDDRSKNFMFVAVSLRAAAVISRSNS